MAVGDLNDDGWLDIVKASTNDRLRLNIARCGDRDWVKIRLHQDNLNRFAIGAQVAVTTGDHTQIRTLTAGGTGYGGSNPPELHFGLDYVDNIDTIVSCYAPQANRELEANLARTNATVHWLGDAIAPRTVEEAVLEGYLLARAL